MEAPPNSATYIGSLKNVWIFVLTTEPLYLPAEQLIWEKVLMGWQRSSVISMVKIYSRRERSFCFVGSVPIGAKDFCGWGPDFYFCISALKRDGYHGQGIRRKQQILPKSSTNMMGLNPLDPKIKDVNPKNIYWIVCTKQRKYIFCFAAEKNCYRLQWMTDSEQFVRLLSSKRRYNVKTNRRS